MASLKDFADLKSLRNTLKDQEQARAVAAAERSQREKKAAHEANLFRNSVSNVARLPQQDKLSPIVPARPMTPRQQEEDDRAVLRESLSDLFEVDALLEEDPGLSYTRPGIAGDVVRKMRKGNWPIQDDLDLHGLRRDNARDSLGEFLRQATRRKLRCVRVIHGKGFNSKGQEPVLKSMVHSWLVQKDEVIAFCQARRSEGGDGALLVLLPAALQVVR
ncbi:Smr/MutS family protein [Janthinobacterium agaricidamnosum]|uniref:Smr domain protein n=1 Tax=Janthinobacterium agaricidamnosum NBRC 102515 = DSM 9628 TaxID=1349767 RepID=W0V3B6_9BURK|nr:Smr/MutS family protein [Janthinobacterium agaricidamnosum]CDG82080.1 smr domain protein [Janthinobacterium agaricidamnosum NBRC 102515 = DSM 9628]